MDPQEKVALIPTLATGHFRDLESRLIGLNRAFVDILSAMASVPREYRRIFKRTALVPYLKHRPGQKLPSQIYWGRICRPRPTVERRQGPREPEKRWIEHLTGRLSRTHVVTLAKDVGNIRAFERFDSRVQLLNKARGIVVRTRLACEQRLIGVARADGWDTETPAWETPLVDPALPRTSKRALDRAWPLCLRLAAAEVELRAIAGRHNAQPVYRGLKLLFERNAGLPYGRSCWSLPGGRLLGYSRSLGKGSRPAPDDAILTERAMRKLRIPAKARLAIRPHEAARRRVERCRRSIIETFSAVKKRTGETIARVARIRGRNERHDQPSRNRGSEIARPGPGPAGEGGDFPSKER